MIWICPVCQTLLHAEGNSVVCQGNHRFDRAKQGYLNLLLAHQKNSGSPGDDRTMLLQRRAFLSAGYYQPLADCLAERAQVLCGSKGEAGEFTVLDTGCGEGYYLNVIGQTLQTLPQAVSCYGSDISKEAAKLSARAYPLADFAVASSFQLPVADGSVDLLMRIFAPGDPSEVARVLSDGGEFWRVAPGPRHLQEMKQALYRQVEPHEEPPAPEGFELQQQEAVTFVLELNSNAEVRQLLEMTPFAWRGSREGRESLQAREQLSVTADFVLQRYVVQGGSHGAQ